MLRKSAVRLAPPPHVRGECRIIRIDQIPLRDAAHRACEKAMSRLEIARTEWRRFESEDLPAFERWRAATFGALLSRIRELEAAIEDRERLIDEVRNELMWGRARNEHAAYARVMHGRADPASASPADEPPPFDDMPEDAPPENGPDEFEQEMLFRETLREFTTIDPDRLDDESYRRMFEDFKASAFGASHAEGAGTPPPDYDFPPKPAPPPRAKELYRLLVRRLHPDVRADGNPQVSALWHDVQAAYEEGNIERLETLLALTEVQSGGAGDHTTLWQLKSVAAELQRALRSLQRSLRQARKQHAWNFVAGGVMLRKKLGIAIQRGLDGELQRRTAHLRALEALIATWAAPPPRRPRRTVSDEAAQGMLF